MFNKNSRTNNVIRTTVVGTTCNIINLLMGFVYRSIFLFFLSSAYLGINGLFTNILQILSFAELGIGGAISFRLYKPISDGNVEEVGRLMRFFKKIYFSIALAIMTVGFGILPFLEYFIKDTAEIPNDVNIYFIYILFLLQTVTSYICVSPQMLLCADQKQYKLTLFQSGSKLIQYIVQIGFLIMSRNYTITLSVGILTTLMINIIISTYVKNQYPEVFAIKDSISKEQAKLIFSDTKSTMCHKIGGTVLSSTDSIILSSFVGLVTTGLYSNYSLIITSLNSVLGQVFGSFTSSLGNTHFVLKSDDAYNVYKKLLFANFWISGMCTVCLVNLISDFVSIWLGKDMILDQIAIIAICLQFYLESIRLISTSYTFGSGLFSKDVLRPLIEAVINISVSIILVRNLGIAGVFFGTVVSHLVTVTWREPMILYKYEFKKPLKEYWAEFTFFSVITTVLSVAIFAFKNCINFVCINIWGWIIEATGCIVVYTIVLFVTCKNKDELKFYLGLIKSRLKRRLRKS